AHEWHTDGAAAPRPSRRPPRLRLDFGFGCTCRWAWCPGRGVAHAPCPGTTPRARRARSPAHGSGRWPASRTSKRVGLRLQSWDIWGTRVELDREFRVFRSAGCVYLVECVEGLIDAGWLKFLGRGIDRNVGHARRTGAFLVARQALGHVRREEIADD